MKNWLKWSAYTILAVLSIAVLVSGGVVFLVIGAIVSLMVLGAFLIAIIAYAIKELWEHAMSSK